MQIAGFWKRIQAFLIDLSLLIFLSLLLEFLFYAQTPSIRFGSPLSLIVSIFYFGILSSYLSHGKTLGKKLLQLKVVGSEGREITPARSFGRAILLLSPFLLLHFFKPDFSLPGSFLLAVAVTLTGTLFYFYLINKESRQSLHDLLTSTFVVSGEIRTPQTKSPIPKWHLLFPLILLGLSTVFFSHIVPKGLKKQTTTQSQSP